MSSLKDMFTFSKKERGGIIALLIVMILSIIIFIFIDQFPVSNKYDYSEFKKEIDQFEKQRELAVKTKYEKKKAQYNNKYPKSNSQLFPFNPNTLSKDSLQLLGLNPKLSERIVKYRNAGGKFKTPEDLKKIYGFPEKKYEELKTYIKVESNESFSVEKSDSKAKKENITVLVNINSADTTELKSLKGIGSKLSQRIVKFRINAGGFYSIDQLTEVYGLKPELFEQIRPFVTVDENYIKININTATAEQLKNHPYIYKWNIANAIVNYRTKHGKYTKVEDLKKTDLVTDEICRKIAPYLIFE
jgi:competence ComEA-like helix-hairpin-helix protein